MALQVSASASCLFLLSAFYKKWMICLFLIDLQNSLYRLETISLSAVYTAAIFFWFVYGFSFSFVMSFVAQMT